MELHSAEMAYRVRRMQNIRTNVLNILHHAVESRRVYTGDQ